MGRTKRSLVGLLVTGALWLPVWAFAETEPSSPAATPSKTPERESFDDAVEIRGQANTAQSETQSRIEELSDATDTLLTRYHLLIGTPRNGWVFSPPFPRPPSHSFYGKIGERISLFLCADITHDPADDAGPTRSRDAAPSLYCPFFRSTSEQAIVELTPPSVLRCSRDA